MHSFQKRSEIAPQISAITSTTTKTEANLQEKSGVEKYKEFEGITTVQYESFVYSLCKGNRDLYAAGVGSLYSSSIIHIVEYSNCKIIRSLTGHSQGIWRGYGHKKTDYLLSLSLDSDIRIWNYLNGNGIAVLKAHFRPVNDIVEGQSGDIITVSSDQSIKFSNMNTFKCYKAIKDAHAARINSILLLNDQRGVTGGDDKGGKIWKANANSQEDTTNSINTGSEIWSGLEVNNSRCLVGGSSGEIIIYDIKGGTQVGKLEQHTNCVNIMVLLSDGSLISGGDDSKLIIWDVNTFSTLQKLEDHTSCIEPGGIEMRENEIASGSKDKSVKIWLRKQ